jgi:hypothetical protein
VVVRNPPKGHDIGHGRVTLMQNQSVKLVVSVSLLLLTTLVAGCGGNSGDRTEEPSVSSTSIALPTQATLPTQTPELQTTRTPDPAPTASAPSPTIATLTTPTPMGPTPTTPPVATVAPPPPPANVTGDGTTASTPVAFPKGLAVITMNHTGKERFRVRLQSRDGSFDRLMGQGTGTWKGSRGVMVQSAGDYVLSVVADGQWQIDVIWPTPETAPVAEVPFRHSGTGDQAVYFVLVQTGPHRLTMTHDGTGEFSTRVLTSEGRRYLGILSGADSATATLDMTIREKAFEFLMLNVGANGNWTIELQPVTAWAQ